MKEYIDIDKLNVDYSYQRPLDMRRAKKIAANFMPELLGVITVSKRDNGKHYIIDGNHRVTAAKFAGENTVFAEVISGLNAEKEASLFITLNSTQKKTTYNENLQASIEAGNERAVHYKDLLDRSGITYEFNKGNGQSSCLLAHSAGMWVMNAYGDEILVNALRLIKSSGKRPDNRLLRGLSLLLTYPSIDYDRLERVLSINPFDEFLRGMNAFDYGSGSGGHKGCKAMAKAIASLYNKNLRLNRIDIAFFDKKEAVE